jgi:predicted Fe-Mo cluster-binding NifX family protein
MKIAVAAMGNIVAGHFGHCENFILFDAENGKIIAQNSIPNPGHRPGFLPNFLADNGANVIISGGMGGAAVEIFNERNVEVIVGAQGDAVTAVEAYLRGELISTGSVCHSHEHAHECGEHE